MYEKYFNEIMTSIRTHGAFLISGNNPPNVIAINAGAIGTFFNRPVFVVPIRESAHTFTLLNKHMEFAVSIPRKDMSQTISEVHKYSGKSFEKFEELHLHPTSCKEIDTYIVNDCGLHIECKVIYRTDMVGDFIAEDIVKTHYANGVYHHFYFGEIVAAYSTK